MSMYHSSGDRTPYTYLIVFKPTGQYYYGSRTAKGCHPTELFNGNTSRSKSYWSSSRLIKLLLKSHGPEKFHVEIRRTFQNKNSCIVWESKVLRRMKVKDDPKSLNMDEAQRPHLAIQNQCATVQIYNIEHRTCMRIPHNKPIPEGWNRGRPPWDSRCSTVKGRKWYHLPEDIGSSIALYPHDPIPENYIPGRHPSIYKKQSETLVGKYIHITNGVANKLVRSDSAVPNGWAPGRTRLNTWNNTNSKRTGMKMFTNGIVTVQILPGMEIPDGFVLGRKPFERRIVPHKKQVVFNNVIYDSFASCIRATEKSRAWLLRHGLQYI